LVAQPDALTIVEWLLGLKNAFMLVYQVSTQARSAASAEDAKNCEESDMAIPARVMWGHARKHALPRPATDLGNACRQFGAADFGDAVNGA
jgi:hypothetical protein